MKRLKITVEGKTYEVEVELLDEDNGVPAPRRAATAARAAAPKPVARAAPKPVAAAVAGGVTSPLAAVVVSVDVAVGDAITEGQKVVTLEAMKMNTIVSAPSSGTVQAIHVGSGDGVEEGQLLVDIS